MPDARGLAILFYATDSIIDWVIGPKVNGGFVLPGMNVTNYNSTSSADAVRT